MQLNTIIKIETDMAENKTESMRSKTPPWPGKIEPKSLML